MPRNRSPTDAPTHRSFGGFSDSEASQPMQAGRKDRGCDLATLDLTLKSEKEHRT